MSRLSTACREYMHVCVWVWVWVWVGAQEESIVSGRTSLIHAHPPIQTLWILPRLLIMLA